MTFLIDIYRLFDASNPSDEEIAHTDSRGDKLLACISMPLGHIVDQCGSPITMVIRVRYTPAGY